MQNNAQEPPATASVNPGTPVVVEVSDHVPDPPRAAVLQRLFRNPVAIAGLAVILVMLLSAILADIISPHPYQEQARGLEHVSPRIKFVMGTDLLGRDVLSRVLYGARISMLVGVCATALSLLIGVTMGMVAGYFGGWVDAVLMRWTDTVAAFPTLLLAVAITALSEKPSIKIVFIALGIVGWTGIARVVRSQVLSVKTLDYVMAARALGADHTRVMLMHVLPNCVSPIIVLATLSVGGNILGEAGLSFLGLGVQDPYPSWGGMLSDARGYFREHWWVAVFPGLAIVLTVLAFNLFGDALRDALDPRSNRRMNR